VLKAETIYEDNLKHGICLTYHPNGNLESIGNYVLNRLEGNYKSYYENGLLESEQTIVDGVKHGKRNTFYRNGALEKIENYINGKLIGWVKTYYDDGSMMKEEYFADGRLQRSKTYGQNGLLISTYGYN